MTVTVDFDNGFTASIDGYKWRTDGPDWFESMLNEFLDPDGPTTSIPDPDHHAAQAAIDQFGGTITHHDQLERVKGRIY